MRRWMIVATLVGLAGESASTQESAKYFPPREFEHSEAAVAYAHDFSSLGEKPITNEKTASGTTYRYLVLSAFIPAVAVTVVTHADGTSAAHWSVSGQRGYRPKGIAAKGERSLSQQETETLLSLVEKAQFWKEPTEEVVDPDNMVLSTDQSQCLVEGADRQRHHVVVRHCERTNLLLEQYFMRDVANLDFRALEMMGGKK